MGSRRQTFYNPNYGPTGRRYGHKVPIYGDNENDYSDNPDYSDDDGYWEAETDLATLLENIPVPRLKDPVSQRPKPPVKLCSKNVNQEAFDGSPLAWYDDEGDFKINKNLVHIEYKEYTQYYNPSLAERNTIMKSKTIEKSGEGVLDTGRAPVKFVDFLYSKSAVRRGIRCTNRNQINESFIKEMLLGSGTNDGRELYNAEQGCTNNGLFFFTPVPLASER